MAACEAVEFRSGLTFAEFEGGRIAQLAILNAAEIVGEAASRVSADPQGAHSDIPWPKIIGMRNRLLHAYFEVNLEHVWDTVQRDIPALISQLEPLVPPETG
ncbi:MAG: DUF86 domain-containing protein [Bryobacterales bacterium]|nr:DUF86 domain-containing protein [Bryobacterales bacterium]